MGSPHQVIQGFLQAKNGFEKDLIEKKLIKENFFLLKHNLNQY